MVATGSQFAQFGLRWSGCLLVLTYFCLILTTLSCKKPDPASELSPADKDVIITNRDLAVNFSNYHTYAIVDSISVVNKGTQDTVKELKPVHQLILKTIDSLMQLDGYSKININAKPDLGIAVSVLNFSESFPGTYYSYISGSPYFGYIPSSSWGLSGYSYIVPGYYGYYAINVGSIAIDMYDLKHAYTSSDKKINLIWNGLIVGANPDTVNVDPSRIVRDIEISFEQSPYLKDGK